VQFSLSEEQALLKDSVERFMRNRYSSSEMRDYRANSIGYSLENWRQLAHMGVLALPFSIEDGGLGGGPREIVTLMEALGSGYSVEPVVDEIIAAGGVMALAGHRGQKIEWLPRIMAGEAHLALAHFEHHARFNLADVRVRAIQHGSRVMLEGEKTVVPLAASADAWIVSAREQGVHADADAVGFYLVSPSQAGIERRDFRLVDGSCASIVRFRGANASSRLRGGFQEFTRAIDIARLAVSAEAVGVMSTLFQSTLAYLRTRKQFGAPLSKFQALQHRLADMYVLIEQSRSYLYRATLCMQSEERSVRCIAGMKSYVSRAALEVGEECVHLHGAIGTTDELTVGHAYKRLVVLSNLFGDTNSELVRFTKLAS
jgi:alkylation response protein AidB-like acyl-CoA dehydrogenase